MLFGPLRTTRVRRPVSYTIVMALVLLPVVIGVGASVLAASYAFPLPRIPAPPAEGYAEPSHPEPPGWAEAGKGYFPASLMHTEYKCRDFPEPAPILDEEQAAWYAANLAAADEPSLLKALEQDAPRRDVYRFTLLISFGKPVIIRIEEIEGGALQMTASRLSGEGGDEPSAVEARVVRQLSRDEAKQFHKALSAANGLRLKAVTCDWGFDGTRWVFEGVDGGRYRFVERWSPKRGRVRALGIVMFGFSGF